MMFGLLPSLKAKKKRPHEDHSHPKRSKIDGPNPTKNPIQFETTLSPPIQEALCKFREASEQELLRLRKEGMDPSTAINKLVEKMRTVESNEDPQPRFTRQELELVMEIAGVNEEGATRALILRSELAKLRHDGFNHPEAINELSRRMKRLAGSKRRGSSSVDKGIEGKHRRREKDTNHTHNTNTTTTTTTSTTPPTSRVSFNSFDPLDDFDFLIPPGTRYIPIPTSTTTTLTPTPTSAATATPDTQTPLSTLSINRKRLQDALMLDGGRYGLLRKRQKYDKDISESDSDNENENESESEGDHYAFFDEGEFSHDDDEKLDEEDDGEDDIFPPIGSLHHHYSSSSSEGEGEERGMEDEGEGEWQSHLLFNEIKEEESDSDDRAWRLAPPSITSPISPSRSHSSTTTTTTTTTTSSSSPSSSYLFSSSTPSPPPTPPHAHSHSSSSSTRTNATRTTKRRDTTTPSSSSSSSSSRVLSHRTKS